jgi:hypothetical protein
MAAQRPDVMLGRSAKSTFTPPYGAIFYRYSRSLSELYGHLAEAPIVYWSGKSR